ncbi:MAG: helix-turn-helix domain-containing protein [Phycisphaerales bacterium]|nr:MAG: helix-turn-helix domain-containing protein [Phycisphaerales bacterium]
MAKTYLSMDEACDALSMTETQIKDLVRGGKLREFRDGGKITYKVGDIEKIAAVSGIRKSPGASSGGSGELILEPADDTGIDLASTGSETGIDLASTGSDVISLAETDSDATAVGDEAEKKDKKDDTVVTSVGVSVFEEDDAEVAADPVAETVISDGGLGIEGVGSGSGLLDLTRESDDTSLGAELLDEILPGEGDMAEMGEATRAGLDEMAAEAPAVEEEPEPVLEAPVARGAVVTRVEYAPDPLSMGLTGLMGVGILVMCVMGLTVAAMMNNAVPALLEGLNSQSWIFGLASVVAAGIATGVGYYLGQKAERS